MDILRTITSTNAASAGAPSVASRYLVLWVGPVGPARRMFDDGPAARAFAATFARDARARVLPVAGLGPMGRRGGPVVPPTVYR